MKGGWFRYGATCFPAVSHVVLCSIESCRYGGDADAEYEGACAFSIARFIHCLMLTRD